MISQVSRVENQPKFEVSARMTKQIRSHYDRDIRQSEYKG